MDILVFHDRISFLGTLNGLIQKIANASILKRNSFHIVLSGGETPIEVYKRLRELDTDWSKWVFYFSDERCYPKNSEKLNFNMAKNALLDHIPILNHQVFQIESYLGATLAAKQYNSILNEVNTFDLVLLGIGEDGHTASLFPGNDLGEALSAPNSIAVFNSPKQPSERVSLTMRKINSSEHIIFLASGESKRLILERLKRGDDLPAAKVKGRVSTKLYFLTENQ